MRLDLLLVAKEEYPSRNKAQEAILSGLVSVNGIIVEKPSMDVDTDSDIQIQKSVSYVSRGGIKLEAAVLNFHLDFQDKTIVDIGASTGGFTDCCLRFGAKKIYAIDVGTNQLVSQLKNNPKVISMENTNIKDVSSFPEKIDYFVMDVSFVSIEHLLPTVSRFIDEENAWICLIKPQFEVGKVYLKNGVVRDRTMHIHVLEKINAALKKYELGIEKMIVSPIYGGSGNKEFIAYIRRGISSKVNFIELCNRR